MQSGYQAETLSERAGPVSIYLCLNRVPQISQILGVSIRTVYLFEQLEEE